MNFVRGRLDGPAVEIGGHRLELPAPFRNARADGAVIVGLRPEFFADSRGGAADSRPTLPALIEITEQLGSETYAYFRVDGIEVVQLGDRPIELGDVLCARLDARTTATAGDSLELAVDIEGLRLFDPETGQSLVPG
jgi:multiple sugar transport system ATP-binding protein